MPRWSSRARRGIALLALGVASGALTLGCGAQYKLPTEIARRAIPVDKSYQLLATWTADDQNQPLHDLQDILLTQGLVFTLFNHGGSGTASRGSLALYPLARPSAIPNDGFPTLFNPIALAAGGDGAGRPKNRLFVLDQGDSCLARANPITGKCDDITGDWDLRVRDFSTYWHVREFGLYGGDTVSTFTDTTVAWVRGIAADDQGRVYVSCIAIVLVGQAGDPHIERTFAPRIYRYLRGPRYPNVTPADWRMPGTERWHRDTTWSVIDGAGTGFIQDAYGIEWGAAGGPALYAADYNSTRNDVQRLSDSQPSTGYFQIGDSGDPPLNLYAPNDVAVDNTGFIYICDGGNHRVMRHDASGNYVQRVDVEVPITGPTAGQALQTPIAVTADDSLVYVADRGLNAIRRYKRRS